MQGRGATPVAETSDWLQSARQALGVRRRETEMLHDADAAVNSYQEGSKAGGHTGTVNGSCCAAKRSDPLFPVTSLVSSLGLSSADHFSQTQSRSLSSCSHTPSSRAGNGKCPTLLLVITASLRTLDVKSDRLEERRNSAAANASLAPLPPPISDSFALVLPRFERLMRLFHAPRRGETSAPDNDSAKSRILTTILMEEARDGRCGVVYYNPGGKDESELYARNCPPADAVNENSGLTPSHADVNHDVRTLLDVDQGGFHEVLLSSRSDDCMAQLAEYAQSMPVVVLVLLQTVKASSGFARALDFLREMSADIKGSHYQHHVMPFAVLGGLDPSDESLFDAKLTTTCHDVGALDIIRSPLRSEDLARLVGHVKATIRPSAHLIGASMTQSLVDSIQCTSTTGIATHRPDLLIPPERRQAIEQAVAQWHFPALDFDMDELTYGAVYMLERTLTSPELEPYRIPRAQLVGFLLATRRQYKHEREVHYHNWRHAVDVTQSLYCFLLDTRLSPTTPSDTRPFKDLNPVERLLTPLDGLLLLASAIGHDVGHPGVNNAFLIACNHPLAQMYNDKSILENYHCAAYSQLLRLHWPTLSNLHGFRSSIISNILATDMQRHFDYMSSLEDLKHKIDRDGQDPMDWPDKQRTNTRELMMALLMKAADISNIARPFDISSRWAKILMEEFARQGQLEQELGIPTCLFGGPPVKDDILAAAQSQKGFMGLFGLPLFLGMTDIMPSVQCAVQELDINQHVWEEKIQHEKQRRESRGESAPLTFSSVSKAEVEEAKNRHHNSEPSAVPAEAFQPPSSPIKRQAMVDTETSSSAHPASRHRHHASTGMGMPDEKRSSAPFLPIHASLAPNGIGSSRRSSKDVALGQMHHSSVFAHQGLSSGSRRGSADASWHFQQSYPGSRRGSKDESLTTILITSSGQGSPTQRASPILAGSDGTLSPESPSKQSTIKASLAHGPRQEPTTANASTPPIRASIPSLSGRSGTLRSQQNQLSPLSVKGQDPILFAEHQSMPSLTDDPHGVDEQRLPHLDGTVPCSPTGQSSPLTPSSRTDRIAEKDTLPAVTRFGSRGSQVSARATPKSLETGVRESRSRSRLRGLKFWKKKRDTAVADGHSSMSP
nr:isoform c of probable 3',5'-cyclic phosphodiesterase pde-4 [Quercus suber]